MASPLLLETVWFDKYKYEDAERKWQEHVAKNSQSAKNNDITKAMHTKLEDDNVNACKLPRNLERPISEKKVENVQEKPTVSCTEFPNEKKEKQVSQSSIVGEIARARQHIKNSLQSGDNLSISLNSFGDTSELSNRVQRLEDENQQLQKMYQELRSVVQKLESKVSILEGNKVSSVCHNPSTPSKPQVQLKDDDDDDIDLFGSDEEDEEAAKVREQRLKDYAAKKSKKKVVIAKSSIVLDVKPWDDETDMKQMELAVRNIKIDGLTWGASKLVPLAFGIFKLQIVCVVEDEKVSVDWLQETIQEIEDYVQSVDIAAFNKL